MKATPSPLRGAGLASLGQIRNSRAWHCRALHSFAHYAFSRFCLRQTAHCADTGYGAPYHANELSFLRLWRQHTVLTVISFAPSVSASADSSPNGEPRRVYCRCIIYWSKKLGSSGKFSRAFARLRKPTKAKASDRSWRRELLTEGSVPAYHSSIQASEKITRHSSPCDTG